MIGDIPPPLLCLAGPTASGKSAAARAIAERWPIEIINVDSATIYRDMDIGTAKPDATERAQVRHHLLDILDPAGAGLSAVAGPKLGAISRGHGRGKEQFAAHDAAMKLLP